MSVDSTVGAVSDNVTTPGTLGSTARLGISVCCLTARTSARRLWRNQPVENVQEPIEADRPFSDWLSRKSPKRVESNNPIKSTILFLKWSADWFSLCTVDNICVSNSRWSADLVYVQLTILVLVAVSGTWLTAGNRVKCHSWSNAGLLATSSLWPSGDVSTVVGWVLLYVHRNRGLIRDGSPGRPPREPVSRRTSVRICFGSPFSSKVVVCGHCLVTLSLTIMKH